MNNSDVSSYLKYLINYANDQLEREGFSKADLLLLYNEWTKFKGLIQSADNIDDKLRNQIMKIDFLDKKLSGDKDPEGAFYVFRIVFLRALHLYDGVHKKEQEKSQEALLDFRDKISGIQFFIN